MTKKREMPLDLTMHPQIKRTAVYDRSTLPERDAMFLPIATKLLDLIESDFGQSGRDVRVEAIRCELEEIYMRGVKRAKPCGCESCQGCDVCFPGVEE
jgi:hypothetical protein